MTQISGPENRLNARLENTDRIFLQDYVVLVDIGAFETERGQSQRLRFSASLDLIPLPNIKDDVDKILSYDTIKAEIDHALAYERVNLLETLADKIATALLGHVQVQSVVLRIEKLDRGPALGVEITRHKPISTDLVLPLMDLVMPSFVMVCLSESMLDHVMFPEILDGFMAQEDSVVLCVSPVREIAMHAPKSTAEQRIALLQIEEAAWHLANCDSRFVVVSSMTEMQWGIKQGQLSVWAPSKIVLDQGDDRLPLSYAAKDLAQWLAKRLGAKALCLLQYNLENDTIAPVVFPVIT